MSKPTFDQLSALQEAVPHLLEALGVKAQGKYITAGICDSADPNDPTYPNLLVVNITTDKTLSIACKIITDDDPADPYDTAYIRCKTQA